MKNGTIFYRIVAADKNRGWVFLLSWDRQVVLRTAAQVSTISIPSRRAIDKLVADAEQFYRATAVDTTEPGLLKKFAKMFGEETT